MRHVIPCRTHLKATTGCIALCITDGLMKGDRPCNPFAFNPDSAGAVMRSCSYLIFCQRFFGVCARSIVFMYRYRRPHSSRIVAYLLFARGHDDLLQRPVTLYSFLQKFCVFVLTLYVQWPWLMTCHRNTNRRCAQANTHPLRKQEALSTRYATDKDQDGYISFGVHPTSSRGC
jgi:hypothetical protein